jgi:hypothetical protein
MEKLLSRLLISLLALSLLACNNQKSGEDSIMVFDIDHARDQITFNIGELFSSGQIVRLETKPEALIGRITELEVSDNYIVIYNQGGRILLFDRQGTFIRHIGQIGKGPFEYSHVNGLAFSSNEDLILADRAFLDDFIGYSIEGEGLFTVKRANKGSHMFELLESDAILSIGYPSVPWKGLTDSINLYHIGTDGSMLYSESPVKKLREIRVGGIAIPQHMYPYKGNFKVHFGQDTLFTYNPENQRLEADAVFTCESAGFDYQDLNANETSSMREGNEHLGHAFVEVYAETKDYYLLHGVEIKSYSVTFEGETQTGIAPASKGFYIADKKSGSINSVQLVDPYCGIDLQKNAYAMPFNQLKFSDNRSAYFVYDAIDFKKDVHALIGACVDPEVQEKLKKLDQELSEEDNCILFIYELKR